MSGVHTGADIVEQNAQRGRQNKHGKGVGGQQNGEDFINKAKVHDRDSAAESSGLYPISRAPSEKCRQHNQRGEKDQRDGDGQKLSHTGHSTVFGKGQRNKGQQRGQHADHDSARRSGTIDIRHRTGHKTCQKRVHGDVQPFAVRKQKTN